MSITYIPERENNYWNSNFRGNTSSQPRGQSSTSRFRKLQPNSIRKLGPSYTNAFNSKVIDSNGFNSDGFFQKVFSSTRTEASSDCRPKQLVERPQIFHVNWKCGFEKKASRKVFSESNQKSDQSRKPEGSQVSRRSVQDDELRFFEDFGPRAEKVFDTGMLWFSQGARSRQKRGKTRGTGDRKICRKFDRAAESGLE